MSTTATTITLSACTDCALIIANDDDSGMSATAADMCRAGIAKWREMEDMRLVVSGDDEHFSMSRCGVCGSSLAGDRIEVTAYPA